MFIQWEPYVKVLRYKDEELEDENNYQCLKLWYSLPGKKQYLPDNLVFIDLGTNGLTDDRCYYDNDAYIQKIPKIRRISALACSTSCFSDPFDLINWYHHDLEDASQNDYVDFFLQLNSMYQNPLFIAHNGYRFDFSILLANLRRVNNHTRIKCADSLLLFKYHFPNALDSASNQSIFEAYSDEYPHHMDLLDDLPTAFERCHMLALWANTIQLPLRRFSIGYEFMQGRNSEVLSDENGSYYSYY